MKRFRSTLLAVVFTIILSTTAFAAKILDNTVLDAALNIIKNNGTTMVFCSSQPTNYADIASKTLITKTGLTSGSYTGPVDDTSGRKLTVNAVTGMTPSSNGTVNYVVITNGSDTILFGTTVNDPSGQAVQTTETWDSPAFKVNVQDPN